MVVLGRKYKKVEETAERINVDKCIPMKCDVSCEDDVSFAIKSVEARFGKIDLLANMAGISWQSERVDNYSFEEFKWVYEINVYGTFLTMKYCLPIMQRQKNAEASFTRTFILTFFERYSVSLYTPQRFQKKKSKIDSESRQNRYEG